MRGACRFARMRSMDLSLVKLGEPAETLVISGRAAVRMDDGDEPYVSLHIMGSEGYAA
jgi:hypothetical protein